MKHNKCLRINEHVNKKKRDEFTKDDWKIKEWKLIEEKY